MKIRFFNTFDTAAPFFRNLLPRLAAENHEVSALLSRREYRPGGLREGDGTFRVRQLPALRVPGLRGRPARLLTDASYAVSAAGLSLFGGRTDLNVFLTQPAFFHAWGAALDTLRHQPYCVVGMDLYPWVATAAGVLAPQGLPARVAESLAVRALTRAEHTVAIGRCMAEWFARIGVSPDRIRVIQNWADADTIRPVPAQDNELRRQFDLQDRFVVMYSGNLGVSHYFDDLLEVARRLRDRPEIVFLFVGAGSRLKEVRRRSEAFGLSNLRFLGYQPYEKLSESLSMGDLHFVSLREGFEGLVVPSKAYGIMAAGRPMLYQGSARGEIARMIDEEAIGSTVRQGDADALEQAVVDARAQTAWREEAGRRARELSIGRYGKERALRAYCDLVRTASPEPSERPDGAPR